MFEFIINKFIPDSKESSQFYRAKIGIFQGRVSIVVNFLLFCIKFSIGLITGAISLIADAIHTLSDMITSIIVIWGFKQIDKPADAHHPYGHGRAEYIATLIIAVLLCVAGVELLEVAIDRIRNPEILTPEWWMIGLIIVTIVIKEITARFAKFLSSKIASGLLHADAWHHRLDAISSTLVIGALIAGKYGFSTIDGWVGLAVALLLIYTGFDIAKDSVDDLIGTPPKTDELNKIREIVLDVPNTLGVHDIVVHHYGHDKYISLHVEIDGRKTAAEAHDISEDVELKLEQNLGVEPTIHIDPVYPENPMVKQVEDKLTSMYSNDNRITNIHDIRIVNTNNHNLILFGVNVSIDMTRKDIFDLETELQKKLSEEYENFEIKAKISPIYKN